MAGLAPPSGLSVIVPVFNRADDLAVLLESLVPDLSRVEVIVVDDGSPRPGVFEPVRTRFPSVRFVRMESNLGPGAARNRGAEVATGDLLFFVDSDTAIVPGTLDRILTIYAEHPEFVACCGTTDREPLDSGWFPAYKALLETSWLHGRTSGITRIGHVGSRAFTIRRDVFLALGGFDERLRTADVEDYEFGYRLRAAHGPIPFTPEIRVRHRYGTLWGQAVRYYRRVILWFALRAVSPGADQVGTTTHEAAGAIACCLMTLLMAAALVWSPLWFAVTPITGLAIYLSRRMLRLAHEERGRSFTIGAFGMHVFLSWFICLGAATALGRSAVVRFRSWVSSSSAAADSTGAKGAARSPVRLLQSAAGRRSALSLHGTRMFAGTGD